MSSRKSKPNSSRGTVKRLAGGAKQVLQEPIMKALIDQSFLTRTQLETLLIDLVVEDEYGSHIPYDAKASLRSQSIRRTRGVSRGAFNRTLSQARRNITRCLCTMLLLAYLGLFDFTLFRPFEEVATRIGDYRRIRDTLSGKTDLSKEEVESYSTAERTILSALEELTSSTILKSEMSRRKSDTEN
ncbi:MAG: hypothetical protein ACFFD6_03095 [Candidatus Thorarchaeota archaeon]